MTAEKGRLAAFGNWLSDKVATLAAHPYAQFAVILFCVAWLVVGVGENTLSVALSVLAITLAQMVLNQQQEREATANRRDIALHAKLDELILASKEARNELAGVEEKEVEEIRELKEAAVILPLPVSKRKRKKPKAVAR